MVITILIIKKLTKVAEGTDNSDAITKHQLDTGLNTKINTSDASQTGNPESRKLVRKLVRSLWIQQLNSDADLILSETDQTINGDKVFSRAITMTTQGTASNHLITKSYVDTHNTNNNYVRIDSSNFMTGDLNMNEQKVKNMLDPVNEQDAVNKRYLESQLQDYLKTNGQNPMTFDLNMNNHKIINLRDTNGSRFDSEAVNKKYVDAEITKIPSANISSFLKKDGTVAMTDNLNMGTNKIKNLSTPATHENDAAVNVVFFNSELNTSNQNLSTQITNAYKKNMLMSHM